MVVGGSQQETMDPGFAPFGTRLQSVLVILRVLMLPDGFDPVSPGFTVRDVREHQFPQDYRHTLLTSAK
ncbi:unnamed protein product [Schistosoma margrebowiei]|uniref:Uncharacterized protein n=1 Tax=Schistosoma margrebowiei TaxID=48269 RepID=A0A183N4V4_9TREM|nr:unnamed protein product [Schistosoma margrebowiei]